MASASAPRQQGEYMEVAVVYGIPINNPEAANLTKRVLNLSIAMALVAVATFIVNLVAGEYFGVGFLVALTIPACGYWGAKNRDTSLLSWFWTCNLACVILFVITSISLFAYTLPALNCACDTECRARTYDDLDDSAEADLDEICDDKGHIVTLYWVGFVIGFFMAALQCAGAMYGRELAHHTFFTVRAAGPVGGHVPIAQPVGAPGQGSAPPGVGMAPPQPNQQLYGHQFNQGGYVAPAASAGGYDDAQRSGAYPHKGAF